jgi:hypothetical protein
MNEKRYNELMNSETFDLTPDEMAEGYHFCNEFDGLLIDPSMGEWEFCCCGAKYYWEGGKKYGAANT